uniref:Preprotein translocase subunit SecA (ATPase, RNA helicase) n=1 Tax=uncultured SAR11 cluster alpha proteobacterium H17925_48B19 TaxID=715039 RepID=E7CA77_9PROT|nr:Preprotein translocase subunit SecA (ATPase, RNA helicase) [uncultured SAR11 cluster alpha proteobacterium H17925_48B19]
MGGLFVIGTERMESRRVDNQARGRSGRQGDEGSSIFYVSLEDDLMRIFGSESMNNILEKLGLKDGESIDHPWINKALERAQQKVEARNFDIRKTLLKFDNVLNDQRQVIFSQRNEVIENKDSKQYSEKFLDEIIDDLKLKKTKKLANAGSNEINMQLKSLFGKSFEESEINELVNLDNKVFEEKIKNKFKSSREERINMLNEEQYNEIEKRIFLQLIDQNWKLHIQYLEQLRQVIGLRSYGQRDPLIEYKKEAFALFENLLSKIKYDLITILFNLKLIEKNDDQNDVQNEKSINTNNNPKCLLVTNREGKISRNERCEATGKKFKHCCGAL